jgi:hypothetical protein
MATDQTNTGISGQNAIMQVIKIALIRISICFSSLILKRSIVFQIIVMVNDDFSSVCSTVFFRNGKENEVCPGMPDPIVALPAQFHSGRIPRR